MDSLLKLTTLKKITLTAAILLVVAAGCSSDKPAVTPDPETPELTEITWDFDNVDGWVYFHQDTATVDQWRLNEGCLELTTRANTYDRTKMHTERTDFADGTYRWRTYVPAIEPGEQVSVGSWIYHDDHHELDFEVGSGTETVRTELNAAPGELVACMTNQDFPFKSGYCVIQPGWHDFEIKLTAGANGNYTATWSIDGTVRQTLPLEFGPEIGFHVYCSVENLRFIGDYISAHDYTALFDKASFTGNTSTPAN